MGVGQPLLGRTLAGRYKVTSHVGEGAMASVFRGTDVTRPGSADVAIKVMHPHLADDRTFSARFAQEAKAASMIRHPRSVAILDVGHEQGIHFIVMEFVNGRDLKEWLKVDRRFAQPRAARVVAAICDALDAAHKLGVVHRDLKPENVMLDKTPSGDEIKVLDFGIAKLVEDKPKRQVSDDGDSDPPPPVTQMGVVVGTPAYMSPEQCRGQPLDGRSDLYTCGILLYQLVTGSVPFHSESPFELAGKQAFEAPPPPRNKLADIDAELEALILRTLSKAPEERPQTAAELRDTLLAIEKRLGGAPRPVQGAGAGFGKTVPMSAIAANLDEALAQARAKHGAAPGGPFAPLGGAGAAARDPLDTVVDAVRGDALFGGAPTPTPGTGVTARVGLASMPDSPTEPRLAQALLPSGTQPIAVQAQVERSGALAPGPSPAFGPTPAPAFGAAPAPHFADPRASMPAFPPGATGDPRASMAQIGGYAPAPPQPGSASGMAVLLVVISVAVGVGAGAGLFLLLG